VGAHDIKLAGLLVTSTSMRPVVSYDDITNPQPISSETQSAHGPSNQPPPKKRKRNNNQKNNSNKRSFGNQGSRYPQQHWDDPGSSGQQMTYDEPENEGYEEVTDVGVDEEDESRELSYEEIWDDSALIQAWDAAAEEYEAYHGPDKSWKAEPIHKSALWYNVPLSPSSLQRPISVQAVREAEPVKNATVTADREKNSKPLNFDTFVPTHDPSLPSNEANGLLPPTDSISEITQDEAFSKALNSMYWTGYWTAVYHCRKGSKKSSDASEEGVRDEEEIMEDEVTHPEGDFVPSQR